MKISLRGWLVITSFSALIVVVGTQWLQAAEGEQGSRLTEQSLGNMLHAMGLEPKKVEQRYDFTFKAMHGEDEWDLSMTAVLSQDETSIWLMAWLDQLPRSAADVPRTALLRLLADNDHLGNGKFFAYVAGNRRFVLQRVIPNENVSTVKCRTALKDLAASVVETYPHWSVANWTSVPAPSNASKSTEARPVSRPTRTTSRASKFQTPVRK